MPFTYAVLGSGQMGVASGYDLAKFGDAKEVLMIDLRKDVAEESAKRINELLSTETATSAVIDVNNSKELIPALEDVDSIISAVPYSFNLALTEIAIKLGANSCDLGGHTGIVRKQLEKNAEAEKAGVSIVPDCGMGPGMNISLAVFAMSLVENPKEVLIWDGGLPQNPKPPWNYQLTFNIGGLTNEYYGSAYFLQSGKVTPVPCFEGFEVLQFPEPLGKLEAAVTSGGLSTMPWTFKGKLERLENKTLRYPGHWDQFKAFSQLGLFEEEPMKLGDIEVVPRQVFHALLGPQIIQPEVKDVGIIRVKCIGEQGGERKEVIAELIDYYDEGTGFTAMQRLTGWHASIVAILSAFGKLEKGAKAIESVVSGDVIVEEATKRGFNIVLK